MRLVLWLPGPTTDSPYGQISSTSDPSPEAREVRTRRASGRPCWLGSEERPKMCRLRPTIATIGIMNANWYFSNRQTTAPTDAASVQPRASR